MRPEQYQLTMGDTGVMISVSIPYTLITGLREGKIRPGDRIVMAGAATGWGFAGPGLAIGRGAGVLRHRHVEPRCPRRAAHG